jgi:hypothetical protein
MKSIRNDVVTDRRSILLLVLLAVVSCCWRPAVVTGQVVNNTATKKFAFQRIATFKICTKINATCNNDTETLAEIIDATPDGRMLVYTDGALGEIGLVNITDPRKPIHFGRISTDGEPTSVVVTKDGKYAVAVVDTSPNFTNPKGQMLVIDIATAKVVAKLELPGQPDSIKVAPNHPRLAIAIENERNETLNRGAMPQLPGGSLVLIDTTLLNNPANWTIFAVVNLTSLYVGMEFPTDPEPEFIDIDQNGLAIVTLQENNALTIINVTDGKILRSGSAGNVTLTQVDAKEDFVVNKRKNYRIFPVNQMPSFGCRVVQKVTLPPPMKVI